MEAEERGQWSDVHLMYTFLSLQVIWLASKVESLWLDTIVPTDPHLLAPETDKIVRRSASFDDQGLTVTPAVTWQSEMLSHSLDSVPLSWVGG